MAYTVSSRTLILKCKQIYSEGTGEQEEEEEEEGGVGGGRGGG